MTTPAEDSIKGSCNCGAITISIPKASFAQYCGLCHCINCRASSGSLFSVNLSTPTKDITITGTPKIYVDKAASGNTVERNFCGDCGSAIMSVVNENPDVAYVKGGLFTKLGVELPPVGAHGFWRRRERWEKPQEGAKLIE